MQACSVEQCPSPAVKKGLCSAHYGRQRKGLPLVPVKKRALTSDKRLCSFAGCERPGTKRGLCPGHYQQERAGRPLAPLLSYASKKTCAGPSCLRVAVCKGLCDGHYQQSRAGKELKPLYEIRAVCGFPACDRPHEAHGFCGMHAAQVRSGQEARAARHAPSPIRVEPGEDFARVSLYGRAGGLHIGKVVGEAFVSLGDVPLVSRHRWRKNAGGYVGTKVSGRFVSMHRMLMAAPPDLEVDHIDGVRHNNRRENLRLVTKKQQAQNRKVRVESLTGLRSVTFEKTKGLYRVISTTNGVRRGHRHKRLEDAVAEAERLRDAYMTHHNEASSSRTS